MQKDRNRAQFLSFPFSTNIASTRHRNEDIDICHRLYRKKRNPVRFKLHLIYKYAISENNCDRKFFLRGKKKKRKEKASKHPVYVYVIINFNNWWLFEMIVKWLTFQMLFLSFFFINSKKKIIVFRNIKIKMEYNTFFLVKMNATW